MSGASSQRLPTALVLVLDLLALGRVPGVGVRGGRQDTACAPREEQASGLARMVHEAVAPPVVGGAEL